MNPFLAALAQTPFTQSDSDTVAPAAMLVLGTDTLVLMVCAFCVGIFVGAVAVLSGVLISRKKFPPQ